jgi:hypothetical protein
VEINLDAPSTPGQIEPTRIIDLSSRAKAAQHISSPVTQGFAAASEEVLVVGDIPASAINLLP